MYKNQTELIRFIPGRKQPLANSIAGPLGIIPIALADASRNRAPINLHTLNGKYDKIIARLFKRIHKGVSVDAFIADPKKSRELSRICKSSGVNATEFQINMRLFAIRKSKSNTIPATTDITISNYLIGQFGPGTETAMLQIYAKYGASVDTMVAHPEIGKNFARIARQISPGGTSTEYRLCALQIRKSRHISGEIFKISKKLNVMDLDPVWTSGGSPDRINIPDKRLGYGLAELTADDQTLFVLRSRNLRSAIERSLNHGVVDRMLHMAWYAPKVSNLKIRYIDGSRLPKSTAPRPWELAILQAEQPPLNWPVLTAA